MMILMMYSTNALPPQPSSIDTANFNQILQPVWQVYNFVKYLATALAMLFLVFTGITYVTSGDDVMKRENAKHTIGYIIFGVIIILGAPYIIQIFTG